ncbi:MAG: NFACT RNA binding domain-containing protein [Clostridia bacterium]|nr:NFACT RNA binding domain-containing protein [Clostridia bacterium]
MAIDALTYTAVTAELNRLLAGGKITKIIQPEKDEIILYLYANGVTRKLLLSANSGVTRLHLTQSKATALQVAPTFCMLLRKHLTNASIRSFVQMPFERVVEINLDNTDDLGFPLSRKLIIELTGKSANLVLCKEDYTILGTLRTLNGTFFDQNSDRHFLTGMKYAFFLPREKIAPDDFDGITRILTDSDDVEKALADNLLGISGQTVHEILYGIDIEPPLCARKLSEIVNRIADYLRRLRECPNPFVTVDSKGGYLDVYPVKYRPAVGKSFESINDAFDDFFTEKDGQQRYREKSKHIATIVKNAVNRTEKKLGLQKQALLESEKAQDYLNIGNLIISNAYALQKGATQATLCDFYNDNQEVTVELDATLSPQQNAQAYFKKAAKMKKSREYNLKLVAENQSALEYLTSLSESIKYSTNAEDLAQITNELIDAKLLAVKANPKAKPNKASAVKDLSQSLLEFEVEGFKVLAGKNNLQNDFLTFRLAAPDDIWLHTQDIHSAHVVIVNPLKTTVPDSVIVVAAQITAYYSQARNSGKTAVDYTAKRFVKRVAKAKPGFAVYTDYNTILVTPSANVK